MVRQSYREDTHIQRETERQRDKETGTERGISHLLVNCPDSHIAGSKARSPELLPDLLHWCRGPRTWTRPYSAVFTILKQGVVWEMEQLGPKLVLIWDAGATG